MWHRDPLGTNKDQPKYQSPPAMSELPVPGRRQAVARPSLGRAICKPSLERHSLYCSALTGTNILTPATRGWPVRTLRRGLSGPRGRYGTAPVSRGDWRTQTHRDTCRWGPGAAGCGVGDGHDTECTLMTLSCTVKMVTLRNFMPWVFFTTNAHVLEAASTVTPQCRRAAGCPGCHSEQDRSRGCSWDLGLLGGWGAGQRP